MKRTLAVLGLAALGLAPTLARAQPAGGPAIERGSVVRLEFTLKDAEGKVLGSNAGGTPLSFTQGEEQIIPGLERALTGMRAGDEKRVVVPPEDGYGPVNPAARAEVPREAIPPEALEVGATLVARDAGGGRRPVVITEIREKTVVLDLNHPLAGKTLHFEIKVLGVEAPRPAAPPPGN